MEKNTSAVETLLLFGATGDLARRMLLPSLYGLDRDGLLPAGLRVIGTGRRALTDEQFQSATGLALDEHAKGAASVAEQRERFLSRLRYVQADATEPADVARIAHAVGDANRGVAIFLSTAPSLFRAAIRALAAAGLTGKRVRLALEKPVGTDFRSSCEINDAVLEAFPEDRTFRLDHYLGKETVQNLLALRFGNSLFEPRWNSAGINHVQITVAETVGLEGRADYYDSAGALRDMAQNHMLQLLSLVAMEPPTHFTAANVRDEKVKVLQSLRAIDRSTVHHDTVRGQYTAGASLGQPVPGYAQELGRESSTETFVALRAHVDNWRWKGVPFYLRTGKRLATRRSEIFIQFNGVPHSIFEHRGAALVPNKLVIQLQPDENIQLMMMVKQPGLDRQGLRLREVPLHLGTDDVFTDSRRRISYERLLLDLIEGDPTLFVRRDEVEAQWHWIDAIREGWSETGMALRPYAAGTWGPTAAIALTERDRVSWNE